jgi:hypothetical protein
MLLLHLLKRRKLQNLLWELLQQRLMPRLRLRNLLLLQRLLPLQLRLWLF